MDTNRQPDEQTAAEPITLPPTDEMLDKLYDDWAQDAGHPPLERDYGPDEGRMAFALDEDAEELIQRAAGAVSSARLTDAITALVNDDGYATVSVHDAAGAARTSPPKNVWSVIQYRATARQNVRAMMRHVLEQAVVIQTQLDREADRARELRLVNISTGVERFQARCEHLSVTELVCVARVAFPSRDAAAAQSDGLTVLVTGAADQVRQALDAERERIPGVGAIEYASRRAAALDELRSTKGSTTLKAHALQLACPATTKRDRDDFLAGRIGSAEFARRSLD